MKKHSSTIYKAISATLLVALMVTIFFLSHQTSTESSATSGSLIHFIYELFGKAISQNAIRTLAHFCEFALLGFLTLNCIFAFTKKKQLVLPIVVAWLYAWSDEIHQLFIPGRAFQLIDLTVDLAGIVLGVSVMRAIIHLVADRKQVTGVS